MFAAPVPGGAHRELSRRTAWTLLALLVVTSLVLRAWRYDHGLPAVFESDYIQIVEAAELLRDGVFVPRSSYPATHTFVYAAADVAAYAVLAATGRTPGWPEFVRALQNPTFHHGIGRLYGAVTGALLAVAVYAVARERLPRGAALVAAAAAALSPASVAYSHQARIHVPGITLLVLASLPLVRLVSRGAGARRAAVAGAAAGLVASVFQLGFVQLGAVLATLALVARPWRRVPALGLASLAGFVAVAGAAKLAVKLSGRVRLTAISMYQTHGTELGIPGLWDWIRPHERFPRFTAAWFEAEPVVALAAAAFAVLALVRRGEERRTLVAYGPYAALVLLGIGSAYTLPRYSLSLTPFAAVLAAALLPALPARGLRAGVGAALVLVPLASSVRFDALLEGPDSRLILPRAVHEIAGAGLRVSIVDELWPDPVPLPPGAERFPTPAGFAAWRRGESTPRLTFVLSDVDVHLRPREAPPPDGLAPADMERLGYELRGTLVASLPDVTWLPDVGHHFLRDLWTAPMRGPTIELWARLPPAREAALSPRLEQALGLHLPRAADPP